MKFDKFHFGSPCVRYLAGAGGFADMATLTPQKFHFIDV